jgi:hypothetical protein
MTPHFAADNGSYFPLMATIFRFDVSAFIVFNGSNLDL